MRGAYGGLGKNEGGKERYKNERLHDGDGEGRKERGGERVTERVYVR